MEQELQDALDRAAKAEAELAELRARLDALAPVAPPEPEPVVAAAVPVLHQDRLPASVVATLEQNKTQILRLIFIGIAVLMAYLGILVAANWIMPEARDQDGIGAAFFQTSKDILLVLTGILGSAMASVFKSEGSASKPSGEE